MIENRISENYNDILTVSEVKQLLHIGKNHVYNLLTSGELKGFQVSANGTWRVPRYSVENYIREKTNQ